MTIKFNTEQSIILLVIVFFLGIITGVCLEKETNRRYPVINTNMTV